MDKWTFRKINYNGQRNNRTNLYMHTRSSLAPLLVDPVLLLDHHQLSCSLIRIFSASHLFVRLSEVQSPCNIILI